MPKTVTTNPEINHSYVRPVIMEIAREVLKWTGQNPEIPIQYTGESEVAAQPNSTIDAENRQVRLPSDSKFYIEVEEDYDAEQLHNVAVLQDENLPYFNDRDLGIRLSPIYVPAVIRLNFKLRDTDSNKIRRWRDAMRIKIAQRNQERSHTVSYYYMVPTEYVEMIESFHTLRESNAPYGEDLVAWWKRCALPSVTVLTTMAGNTGSLVVKETASRVQGQFDFEIPEKANKDNEASAHVVAFSYVIRCDIPMGSHAVYPPLIHQKQIDEKYIQKPEWLEPDWVASRASMFTRALRYFERARELAPRRDTGYRIPHYNDYRLQVPPPNSQILLSALTTLEYDEHGKSVPLLNFKDLKDVVYTDAWLKLLKAEHKFLNKWGASPLWVVVAENGVQLHHSRYEVTEDLDVVFTDLGANPRYLYHVALYIVRDPTIIYNAERLTDADNLDTYVSAACPDLVGSKNYPVPFDGTYSQGEVRWIIERVRRCNNHWSQQLLAMDTLLGNNRVGYLTVEVDRKE